MCNTKFCILNNKSHGHWSWWCSVHRGRFQSSSGSEEWYFVILTEVIMIKTIIILTEVIKMTMKSNGKF